MGLSKKKEVRNFVAPIGPNLSFASSEAFNLVRTNIRFSCTKKDSATIVAVTSATPSDGKSYCAINLAYSLSKLDVKTLIIDCDLRKPSVAKKLGIPRKTGLTNLLLGEITSQEAVQKFSLSEMYFIDSGIIPSNPSEVLASQGMKDLLENLSKEYKYIVLDLPPIGSVSDPVSLSGSVDGVVLVVRKGLTQKRHIREAVRQLQFSGMNIFGFIFNGDLFESKYYKNSYKSYYKYYRNYKWVLNLLEEQ